MVLCGAFLAAYVISFAANYLTDRWQFKPGAVIASGSRLTSLRGAPARLVTVHGHIRKSDTELTEVSIYHALIIAPQARVTGGGGSSSTYGPLATEAVLWHVEDSSGTGQGTVTKSLIMKLHGIENTVTVGPEEFELAKGNLLIVRLNTDWVPSTTQIPLRLDGRAGLDQVVKHFKAALPEDELAQALSLW